MLEEFQKLELISLNLSSQLMLISGASILAGGLFVWIGGMRWRILTALLAGVLVGSICILFVNKEYHGQAFGFASVAGFGYVMLFKKRGMVLVGALLAAIVCALAAPSRQATAPREETVQAQNPDYPLQVDGNERLSAEESFRVLWSQYVYLGREFLDNLKNTGTGGIITAITVAILVGGAGFVLSNIVSAAATSAVGTLFIFTGMIIILLQKGSAPITLIYQKFIFYQTIAVFMIILGTFTGVVFCPEKEGQPEQSEDKKGRK